MPELEAWSIGRRGEHPDVTETSPDNRQREDDDPDTVSVEDKDESAPGSVEWKERPRDLSRYRRPV